MAGHGKSNWRAVKMHRNYTVDEAARVLGRDKGTIRRWIAKGLPAIKDQKPHLILGTDLIEFLKTQTVAQGINCRGAAHG